MTPDRALRAISALEAAWRQDADALLAPAAGTDDEPPLARIVAAFGAQCLHAFVVEQALQHLPPADHPAAQAEAETGPAAHLAAVWEHTTTAWADTIHPGDEATESFGAFVHTVLDTLMTFFDPHTTQPAQVLATLRRQALSRT